MRAGGGQGSAEGPGQGPACLFTAPLTHTHPPTHTHPVEDDASWFASLALGDLFPTLDLEGGGAGGLLSPGARAALGFDDVDAPGRAEEVENLGRALDRLEVAQRAVAEADRLALEEKDAHIARLERRVRGTPVPSRLPSPQAGNPAGYPGSGGGKGGETPSIVRLTRGLDSRRPKPSRRVHAPPVDLLPAGRRRVAPAARVLVAVAR